MSETQTIFSGDEFDVIVHPHAHLSGAAEKIEIRLRSSQDATFIEGVPAANKFRVALRDLIFTTRDPKDTEGRGKKRIEEELVRPAYMKFEAARRGASARTEAEQAHARALIEAEEMVARARLDFAREADTRAAGGVSP